MSRRKKRRPTGVPRASEVVIFRTDGTQVVQPARPRGQVAEVVNKAEARARAKARRQAVADWNRTIGR